MEAAVGHTANLDSYDLVLDRDGKTPLKSNQASAYCELCSRQQYLGQHSYFFLLSKLC